MDNNQVANVIQAIADKLGVAAVHLWPEMVRHTWIHATMTLVTVSLWLLVTLLLVPNFLRYCTINWEDANYDQGLRFSVTIRAIVVMVLLLGSAIASTSIPDSFAKVMAPEGATVMNMLKLHQGNK